MPRIVPDINVLVSGLINERGPAGRIQAAWRRDELSVVTSQVIITKTDEVLHRPHIFDLFPRAQAEARIQGLLKLLRNQTIRTPYALDLRVVEDDPEDDTIIIAAVEGKADCIVSGDRHLKSIGSYGGIAILPRLSLLPDTVSNKNRGYSE